MDLAVFLAEAEPPAFFLRDVIFDGECDDGTDAWDKVKHAVEVSCWQPLRDGRPSSKLSPHTKSLSYAMLAR